ncbi:MAG: hypothetical protein ABFD92_02055 [Planctomycetaceae bacterium]|nr:hypothetical protein [Planctomycetaceae bacterium]
MTDTYTLKSNELEVSQIVGLRIRQSMGETTVKDLADFTGWSEAEAAAFLDGSAPIPLAFLAGACIILNISADWLLTGSGTRQGVTR